MNKILNYIMESRKNMVILRHKTLPIAINNDFTANKNKDDNFEIYIQIDCGVDTLINISAWVQFGYSKAEQLFESLFDTDDWTLDGGCGGGSTYEYLIDKEELHLFSNFYNKLNLEEWEILFTVEE